jgi:RHS repeat-associated protein
LGSGDSDVFTYDTNTNRMTKYQFNIGTQTFTGIPAWNSNGSFASLSITDPFYATDTQNCTYSHDDLARISSANCGSVFSQTFSYDAFGNLTKSGTFGFHPTYNSATNRYSSLPGATVSYDSAGNLLSDGTNTFAWDAFGKAINVRGHAVTYDAFGNMVEADYPSEFFYSPDGAAYILFKGQTARQASYYLPGGAQAMYDEANGGLILYRHADYLGNVRANSTPSRTFSYTQAYAPFGEPYAQSSVNIGTFAGLSNTFSLDLYDTPNREYSDMGRWSSPDPAGLAAVDPTIPQSWNRYAYVLNNPLSSVDPLGLCGEDGGFDDDITCDNEGETFYSAVGGDLAVPSTACTDAFDPCTQGSVNAGAQPNLAAMFNEGPGGYSYQGVDALVALDCAAENNSADNGCWGVKLSLNGGLLQGSWSLDAYAAAAEPPSFKPFFGSSGPRPDPLDPSQLIGTGLKPSPLPNPTASSYVCPALVTQIRQLQLQSVGNPSIASQLAALQAMYQKSCH